MITLSKERLQKHLLVGTAVMTTLAISPGIGYDPINLPKMLVIVTGASFLLIPLIGGLFANELQKAPLPILAMMLAIGLAISMFTNSSPTGQQFWGTWGRSTGLLTYLAFVILMLTSYLLAFRSNMEVLRAAFERLSYFISAYTLAQAGNIDPIAWSQKLMVATLGNINFMSSFLGMASCSMFARVINEKIPITAKIQYSFFIALNLFLIWISESIQGIGVLAAGVVVAIAFKIRAVYGIRKSMYWLVSTVSMGLIAFLGTAGVGPLSLFTQETVIFRLDYWRAGVSMTINNWINGVGIDSYGDYYEQYRDLDAVLRTGPQRVTNTAHNIFLDVSSGSGALVGLIFLMIFIFTLLKLFVMLRRGQFSSTDVAFASVFGGFLVFCLISINQIGVGVWGFIAMGYLNGVGSREEEPTRGAHVSKAHSKRKKFIHSKPENLSYRNLIGTILIGLLGVTFALAPNIVDARMLNAVQQLDFDEMRRISSSDLSASYHRNKYQTLAVERARLSEAFTFAVKEIERNPRNGISWRIIAYSDLAPRDQKEAAIERLMEIDPLNEELLNELKVLEKSIA